MRNRFVFVHCKFKCNSKFGPLTFPPAASLGRLSGSECCYRSQVWIKEKHLKVTILLAWSKTYDWRTETQDWLGLEQSTRYWSLGRYLADTTKKTPQLVFSEFVRDGSISRFPLSTFSCPLNPVSCIADWFQFLGERSRFLLSVVTLFLATTCRRFSTTDETTRTWLDLIYEEFFSLNNYSYQTNQNRKTSS